MCENSLGDCGSPREAVFDQGVQGCKRFIADSGLYPQRRYP